MKISIASGYFNPIHPGHISLLEEAKRLGDFLVVIVNNDQQVTKKNSTPFLDEQARLKIVASIKYVDLAVMAEDSDDTVTKTLESIRNAFPSFPMVFANGGDRNTDNHVNPEVQYCRDNNIDLAYNVGSDKVFSSSKLIKDAVKNKMTEWGIH